MITPISIVIPYRQNNSTLELWVQERTTKDDLHKRLEFPGGKVENDESPKAAAIREVKEETGVNLLENEIEKLQSFQFRMERGDILIMVFLFSDSLHRFDQGGFQSATKLLESTDKIPPNNVIILKNIIEYFQ